VTLWEIFTLGDVPFPNETWDEEFIGRISSGMRMGKPKHGNLEMYGFHILYVLSDKNNGAKCLDA